MQRLKRILTAMGFVVLIVSSLLLYYGLFGQAEVADASETPDQGFIVKPTEIVYGPQPVLAPPTVSVSSGTSGPPSGFPPKPAPIKVGNTKPTILTPIPKPVTKPPTNKVTTYEDLKQQIATYLGKQTGTYGLSFTSLTTGATIDINASQNYVGASTVKLPINLYLYHQAALGRLNLEERVTYLEQDYEEGTGWVAWYATVGDSFTLRELAEKSIVYSDNVASRMLMRHLGWENICVFEESIVGPVAREGNYASPSDMNLYFQYLLQLRNASPDYANMLLYDLENTIFNDRIPLYLPKGTVVAHKIGTQVRAAHDVGIIFAEKPFILAVMSDGIDENDAAEVIGRIARMIYDFEQAH